MSNRLDTMAPVEVDPLDGYSPVMAGAGRWFVWLDDDGAMFGVLWTDDGDALGLLGTEGTDTAYQAAGMAEIRRAKANGYTASEVFDGIEQQYLPGAVGSGDLASLLSEL